MNIGIDIDNTLTNTSIISNTLLKNSNLYNGVLDYHELSPSDARKFLTDCLLDIVWNVKIKEDALEVLKYWKRKGYKLIFITARGTEDTSEKIHINSICLTSLYFIINKVGFDGLVFFQEDKSNACKKYNIDVFIDDKEKVLDEIKNEGIKTVRITNDEISNHKIAHNWQEIKDYVDSLGE